MKFFMQKPYNQLTLSTYFFSFILLCTFAHPCNAIVTFFLKPYPYPADIDADNPQEAARSLRTPGNMALQKFKNFIENSHLNVGILSTYSGYLAVSDFNGQIVFPRTQEKPFFHLLITNRLTPVIMLANTIHHWEIEEDIPAALYTIERKEDEETKLLYWTVQAAPLPEDRRISLDTIIIIAKPKYVYVPEGATLTNTNPQFILPNIYIKRGITRLANALYTLNVRHFFGPVKFYRKKEEKRYIQQTVQ